MGKIARLLLYSLPRVFILFSVAFREKVAGEKVKKAGWLATVGGFLDYICTGGGWGTW